MPLQDRSLWLFSRVLTNRDSLAQTPQHTFKMALARYVRTHALATRGTVCAQGGFVVSCSQLYSQQSWCGRMGCAVCVCCVVWRSYWQHSTGSCRRARKGHTSVAEHQAHNGRLRDRCTQCLFCDAYPRAGCRWQLRSGREQGREEECTQPRSTCASGGTFVAAGVGCVVLVLVLCAGCGVPVDVQCTRCAPMTICLIHKSPSTSCNEELLVGCFRGAAPSSRQRIAYSMRVG